MLFRSKARALLGYKGLAWHSVFVPRVAPKPDLTALTAGYRKVPVLQCGADVYCDTRLIAEVLNGLAPTPTWQAAAGSLSPLLENWVDQVLFGKAVGFVFGQLADMLPDALLADRAALRGAPLEREGLKAALPVGRQELLAHFAWLELALADGRTFFNGPHPGPGDFTLYSTVWFCKGAGLDLADWPALSEWFGRMAGFGHGLPTAMDANAALDVALAATPLPVTPEASDASGLTPGQHVSITPESLGHGTTVSGELLAITPQRISIRHHHERCGTVHIHFPRLGYRVKG